MNFSLTALSQTSKIIVPDYKLNTNEYVYSLEKTKLILKQSLENNELKDRYENDQKKLKLFIKLSETNDSIILKQNETIETAEKKEINLKEQNEISNEKLLIKNVELKGLKKQKTILIIGGVVISAGLLAETIYLIVKK